MASFKALIFLCLAVAMVMSTDTKRVKKQVLAGAYPYSYSAYASPSIYSSYASPSIYSSYASPSQYIPTAYSGASYPYEAYSGYPYSSYHVSRKIYY